MIRTSSKQSKPTNCHFETLSDNFYKTIEKHIGFVVISH